MKKVIIKTITALSNGFLLETDGIEDHATDQPKTHTTFLLKFTPKTAWKPYKIARVIAKHMQDNEKKKDKKSRRYRRDELQKRLRYGNEEFNKKVDKYFHFQITGDLRISNFRLWSLNNGEAHPIKDENIRKSIAKVLVGKEKDKRNDKFYYWLGDYEKIERVFFETEKKVEDFLPPELHPKSPINKIISENGKITYNDNEPSEHILGDIPLYPQCKVIGREKDLDNIIQKITKAKNQNCIIHGWPGVGKTTLATILSYDKRVQSIFTDGIIWAYLGQNPTSLYQLRSLGFSLKSSELSKASEIEEAIQIINRIISKKKMLLIVDDVWNVFDIKPFLRLAQKIPAIITTRIQEVAYSLSVSQEEIYKLDILSDEDSLNLLKELVPHIVKDHSKECMELVLVLEGLPLAIRVAGHLLRKQNEYGLSVARLLGDLKQGHQILDSIPPSDALSLTDEATPTVAALLRRSTDYLNPTTRDYFSILAYFAPKPAVFDIKDLKGVWRINDPEPTIKELVDFGLIEPFSKKGSFQIHYLMVLLAKSLLEK